MRNQRWIRRGLGAALSLALPALLLGGAATFAATDNAQLISVTVPAGSQVMPRTVFIQTWTFKNTGTTTWSPGQGGCTLNIVGTDSLAATRLVPNTISKAYHPSATMVPAVSVLPGGMASYSLSFIAPEVPGSYKDTFQLNGSSGTNFGPQVTIQITVPQAGSTNQYDRARAVSYANNYVAYVCSDNCFWTNGSSFGRYAPMSPVPTTVVGDDCAHFVSCCIGTQSAENRGGGLTIPSRGGTYGEPGATRLVNTVLIGGGYAVEVPSLSMLSPGDVIGWNWGGDPSIGNLDHVTLYVGNGLVAAHAASHLDISATTYYQSSEPNCVAHYIHILDAPTLSMWRAGNNLVLAWGTNWTGSGYALYSARSADPKATWSKYLGTPSKVGKLNMVTNTMPAGAAFYRLMLP